jgi:hypothetical protein
VSDQPRSFFQDHMSVLLHVMRRNRFDAVARLVLFYVERMR